MKNFFKFSALAAATLMMVSCSSNDDPNPADDPKNDKEIEITSSNLKSWTNYMRQVATLLSTDANNLRDAWTVSYNGGAPFATQFKSHSSSEYPSANSAIEEIVDKCAEIANEVGQAKIGDPYALYAAGRTDEALYAVESWYSWHSRDDYSNNIRSIRNAYYGAYDAATPAANSLSAAIAASNADLDANVRSAIDAAEAAILGIQQPFRNNIPSAATVNAMEACADLEEILNMQLKPAAVALPEATLHNIVDAYVDNVVVPTYTLLAQRNAALKNAVEALASTPTTAAFEAAANAWLSAREPWEKSEAFLFGPVDAMGLDPNMDSWPLDQSSIVQILNSGNFDDLDWTDGDDDEAIEAKQGVRGFHTLEFLIFSNGRPRTINF
ncbi:MAG: hypothetical protein NC342_05085 [Pseudoflavonifractor sp.]|nr:peptidase M75 [Alloprevotella sp.]MCM1116893.1 hypothetical protein [Pseudoflavonifractor sp.]